MLIKLSTVACVALLASGCDYAYSSGSAIRQNIAGHNAAKHRIACCTNLSNIKGAITTYMLMTRKRPQSISMHDLVESDCIEEGLTCPKDGSHYKIEKVGKNFTVVCPNAADGHILK